MRLHYKNEDLMAQCLDNECQETWIDRNEYFCPFCGSSNIERAKSRYNEDEEE